MLKTALYLIPVPLGDTPVEQVLPSYNREVIAGIRHFIVGRCGGDCPAGTFACGSIGGPFVNIDVADGFGIQRAEFRFSGLSAYRGGRTDKENQAARTTGICRGADADIYRNALS